jgi:hypothetical protein
MNKYQERIEKAIFNVNEKLFNQGFIKPTGDLNEKVKKVVVILTASRSGSTLMKSILSQSNNIAYLSGEEEPYYILTKNAFPWTESDAFTNVKDKQKLLDIMFSDMGINIPFIDVRRTAIDWQKRILYQYPEMKQELHELIESKVHEFYGNSNNYEKSTRDFINSFMPDKRGYYDLFANDKQEFTESIKIEEPPFVIPSKKRSFTEKDASKFPLLLKTPQDCYRIGLFEQLFPNAEIKYIHLSRGFAQTINGLLDGWHSKTGFFAHNMISQDIKLNIDGYSNVHDYGNWWKFDLPPNWREFTDKPLEDVCLNQWLSAHDAILESKVDALRVKFEDFLISPQEIANDICDYIGIPHVEIGVMPIVMSTDIPSLFRWKKREQLFTWLSKDVKIQDMMYRLGYSMNPLTWI